MPSCCHGDLTLHSFIQSLFSSCVALNPFWWMGSLSTLGLRIFLQWELCWDEQQEHSLTGENCPRLEFDQSWVWKLDIPQALLLLWCSWDLWCSGNPALRCKLGFFSVVAVSRAGEKHLKEASFHLRWIWLVHAHNRFLLGQKVTFWQPDSSGSCVCGCDHFCTSCAQVMVHFHFSLSMCMNRYSGMGISSRYHSLCLDFFFCPSVQRKLWAENPNAASSLLEF